MTVANADSLSFALHLASVTVPVALYFLVLGLLNSRRSPQLLTGRQDFALLVLALSPLAALPALGWLGLNAATVGLVCLLTAASIYLLAPQGRNWVIYNLRLNRAHELIRAAAARACGRVEDAGGSLRLDGGATVRIGGFPILRNVSVRLESADDQLARRFESAMLMELAAERCEAGTTGVSLIMAAAVLMAAPAAMLFERMPEMARLLTDFFQ